MPPSTFSYRSADGTQIAVYRWDPAGEPRAAVQLTHGMAMFAGARRGADPAQVAAIRSSLPVYIAVGEADPINAGLALLTPLTEPYKAAGLTDVTIRTYPGARHEILNEINRDEVIAELTSWLDRVVASSSQPS